MKVFQVAMDLYSPPGITHPILKENYAWVDERLREMYYGYALTSDNYDEFKYNGLLKENYDWVDRKLEEMCKQDEVNNHLFQSLNWCNYKSEAQTDCIKDKQSVESSIGKKRKSPIDMSDSEEEEQRVFKRLRIQAPVLMRSDSDISELTEDDGRVSKRLRCSSPHPKGKYINVPCDEDECVDDESIEFVEDEEDESIYEKIVEASLLDSDVEDMTNNFATNFSIISEDEADSAKVWPASNESYSTTITYYSYDSY
jgi:hypothetical protein